MSDRSSLVLASVLRLIKPAARLLLRHGVDYRAFSLSLKRVFLEAAQDELESRAMPETDSAITLLSGVHRRDVRELLRQAPAVAQSASGAAVGAGALPRPASLATEVVARWLHQRRYRIQGGRRRGQPRTLPRGTGDDSFDALVAGVSQDVRPRALLDELLRLGVAREVEGGVELVADSFTPRAGFEEVTALFADNLHDHVAAAAQNLDGGGNFLEQSIFVDQITQASAAQLQRAAVLAWKQAFQTVMEQAQQSFDDDARDAPAAQRNQRGRFGVYFYSAPMDGPEP